MNKYITDKIAKLKEYTPQSNSCKIILDANENPYSLPQIVVDKIHKGVDELNFNRYPDPMADNTVEAFCRKFGTDKRCVTVGNGSDELISVIISGFLSPDDTMIVVVPDFSMYDFYGGLVGANIIRYVKSGDFSIDFDELSTLAAEKLARMVIFSNPCNPTGKVYSRDDILEFASKTDALIIVDEAYMEFSSVNCSVLDKAESLENVIVLKTLSKAFGLASMRCGFAVSNPEISSALKKIKSPYNVNSLTQAAAAAALENADELLKITEIIKNKRDRISECMKEIAKTVDITVYPSDTNFVLVKVGEKAYVGGAKAIFDALCEKGIRVRLMGEYLRISAGTETETDEFITAIKSIMLK